MTVKLTADEYRSQYRKGWVARTEYARKGRVALKLVADNTKTCRCAQNPRQCPVNLSGRCKCEEN